MPPVLGTGRASLETHSASSLSASQGLGHSRFRLSCRSSTLVKASRELSLGDTAQSAETVGNRLSFGDKIPSQAPSIHEPAVGGVGTAFPDARLKTTIGLSRSGQKGEG